MPKEWGAPGGCDRRGLGLLNLLWVEGEEGREVEGCVEGGGGGWDLDVERGCVGDAIEVFG